MESLDRPEIKKRIKEAFDLADQFIDNDRAEDLSIETSSDVYDNLKENGLIVYELPNVKPLFRGVVPITILEDKENHLIIKYEDPLKFDLKTVLDFYNK